MGIHRRSDSPACLYVSLWTKPGSPETDEIGTGRGHGSRLLEPSVAASIDASFMGEGRRVALPAGATGPGSSSPSLLSLSWIPPLATPLSSAGLWPAVISSRRLSLM